MTKKDAVFASEQAINIHFLERFVGDFGMKGGLKVKNSPDSKLKGLKVAVVGSGPCGIMLCGRISAFRIKVTVFEALHSSGGVLRYGIPPFRMPRDILDFEIDYLKKLRSRNNSNFIVGKRQGFG